MKHELLMSLVLITLSSLYTVVQSQTKELKLFPTGMNYSLFEGQRGIYNCSSLGFDTVIWSMNNTALTLLTDLSYTLTKPTLIDGYVVSTLDIQPSLKYNGSDVSCSGIVLPWLASSSDWVDSRILVQGVPGKVLDFQGDNITETRLRFWWTPPFHNPGIPPCCNSYSINITNVDSGESVFDDHYTTDTFIEFDVTLAQLCSLYSIQVIAYNNVGEGDVLDTTWSRGGYFRANEAAESLFYTPRTEQLNLGVNVTINGYCLNDLDNMTLIVECESVAERLQQTNDIQASKTERELQQYIQLEIRDTHKDKVCFYDVGLENNVDLPKNPFRTFDTRSVNVYAMPGMICASCQYIPSSPGKGCVLVAFRVGINRGVEHVRNISINETEGCVDLSQGRYQVRVYDWQLTGGRSEISVHDQVLDVPMVVDVIPSPSIMIVDRVINDGFSSGAITGIVVAVVLVMVLVVVAVIFVTVVFRKKSVQEQMVVPAPSAIQLDSSTAGTIELNQGEPVGGYDHLKEILKEDIQKWEDSQNWGNVQIKLATKSKHGYRYILITQSID